MPIWLHRNVLRSNIKFMHSELLLEWRNLYYNWGKIYKSQKSYNCFFSNTAILFKANQFICRCPCGFTGQNCGLQVSFCDGLPCLNGGLCSSVPNSCSFQCNCANGYQGTRCEQVLDPCVSNPCMNGYCSRKLNQYSYACFCNPGFTGTNCELQVNLCTGTTCKNSGLCISTGLSYSCQCLPGYTGKSNISSNFILLII